MGTISWLRKSCISSRDRQRVVLPSGWLSQIVFNGPLFYLSDMSISKSKSKIVRTICGFRERPTRRALDQLQSIASRLEAAGYVIQTKRFCTAYDSLRQLDGSFADPALLWGVGRLDLSTARQVLQAADMPQNPSFHLDLTTTDIDEQHIAFLFELIERAPSNTFNFTYVFQNRPSSPFFPSAQYERDGFAIGLQPTDLAEECETLEEWLHAMQQIWMEIDGLFGADSDFLGIDASIAPLFSGSSSLLHIVKQLGLSFADSVMTDFYMRITDYLHTQNPRAVGLCGLMFPCLEDFELAAEYEAGRFSIERNLFLALHCGLGIDTYPIGIDENPQTILHILRLLQRLAKRYQKPLSARFVSDGQAKIGDQTDFGNPYLKDVTVRPLQIS